jgi:hypothetical protein
MRFHRVTSVCGMPQVWTALERCKNAPKRGDPGDRMQPCIYGPTPAFIPSFAHPLRRKLHLAGIDRWPRSGLPRFELSATFSYAAARRLRRVRGARFRVVSARDLLATGVLTGCSFAESSSS